MRMRRMVLPDPYGPVKSHALRSRRSSIRLPLNISDNRNTAIAHALSSYRGSGMHHIAFDCADIFADVSRAKETGDRCWVSRSTITLTWRHVPILTRRFSASWRTTTCCTTDARGGELFHVYTEPFEGRFFFEIIQRKNGYAG